LHTRNLPRVLVAVIFDLDGVLLDSEQVWNAAKEELVRDRDGRWSDQAPRDMMGMSSPEWSAYLRDELGVDMDVEEISADVVRRLEHIYRERLPLHEGAVDAVERAAASWPLGLASSSNREIIELFLELSGLRDRFAATISSEEVERGKPAPDVYLETARRMNVDPDGSAAVEDSENGIRSAKAAGMYVVALPNEVYPPADDALTQADAVISSLTELQAKLEEAA
jgi:HAD superfamily hydrolase (TIGR01509 family)